MSGYCFHVAPSLKHQGQNDFSPTLADCLCSVYRKPVLLVGSLYRHFICVWAWDAVSRGCVLSESSTFSLDDSESEEAWSPVLFKFPATVQSSRSMVTLVGLEGELAGCYSHCSKLGPAFSTNLGMFLLPQAELCSPQPLGSWYWSSCHVDCWVNHWKSGPTSLGWGWHWTQEMGTPLGECLQRGCLARVVLEEEEFQLDMLDCWRDLELAIPLAQVLWQ